ncbi:MAG: antibiotic biosynthesis monooxygenase [Oricola sp.]
MTGHVVQPGEEGPVTVSISRRVKPGREAEYEEWLHGIIAEASGFPGHQGVNILRPSPQTGGRYVLIYRFDDWAHCQDWENSDVRAEWIERLDGLVEGETHTKRVTGLEFWFDLPEVPAAAHAPRYKMAVVLVIVVFALVFPLQVFLGPLLAAWPAWARSLLIVMIQVLLMTYVVMPRVTRVLKDWLYAK